MESKKTFHLLALIFSLLIIEISMASRILAKYNPPLDNDNSRIRANRSTPEQDGSWNGNSSDQGMLLVPPPATKTTIEVSTAVSPTSATSRTSVSRSSNTSSISATGGRTISKSSYNSVSESSNTTRTKYP